MRLPVHVAQLRQRRPALVFLAPLRPRRQPDGEGLGEVLVGMLLRVPAGDVAHEAARERDRAVVVAVRAAERTEEIAPLRRLVQLVGIVEGVPRLVAEVHQDLALVLEIVHRLLEARELRIGEIERDPDHGLAGRTAPFVGQIAERAKFLQALAFELAVKLLNVPFEVRSFELEPELLDGLGQDLLDIRRGFFKGLHAGAIKGSTKIRAIARHRRSDLQSSRHYLRRRIRWPTSRSK